MKIKDEPKKAIFSTKDDVLITKEDLIRTIDHAKNETILWLVLMGVLEFIGYVLIS